MGLEVFVLALSLPPPLSLLAACTPPPPRVSLSVSVVTLLCVGHSESRQANNHLAYNTNGGPNRTVPIQHPYERTDVGGHDRPATTTPPQT